MGSGFRNAQRTELAGGITCVNARFSNVLGYYRPGANHHVVANRDRQNRGVGSDTDVVSYASVEPALAVPMSGSAGAEEVIDKHDPMRDDAIVANGNTFADEAMGLHLAATANPDAALDFYKWTNSAFSPYFATIKIDGLGDTDVASKADIHDANGILCRLHFMTGEGEFPAMV